jgi:hypothetical protein
MPERNTWELVEKCKEEVRELKRKHLRVKDNLAEMVRYLLMNPNSTNIDAAKYIMNSKNKMREYYNPP